MRRRSASRSLDRRAVVAEAPIPASLPLDADEPVDEGGCRQDQEEAENLPGDEHAQAAQAEHQPKVTEYVAHAA